MRSSVVEAARRGKKPQPPKKKKKAKSASGDEDLPGLSKQELLDRASRSW